MSSLRRAILLTLALTAGGLSLLAIGCGGDAAVEGSEGEGEGEGTGEGEGEGEGEGAEGEGEGEGEGEPACVPCPGGASYACDPSPCPGGVGGLTRCEQRPDGSLCWATECDCSGCAVGQHQACTCGAEAGQQACTKEGGWGECKKACSIPNPDGGLDLEGKQTCTNGTWGECAGGCADAAPCVIPGQVADPEFGCGCFDTYRDNVDCTATGLAANARVATGIRTYVAGQWRWQSCQARACNVPFTLQGTDCVACQTEDQCLDGEELVGCLCKPWPCPEDELICQCGHEICTTFNCGPEFCDDANGCAQKNPVEYEANCAGEVAGEDRCVGCHGGIEKAHVPFLRCTQCHGGDPDGASASLAHIAKPTAMEAGWQSTDPTTGTYFNFLTHVGLEDERFDDPSTPDVHEGLAWLQFENPADLRVADKTCGAAGCHTAILEQVNKSLMRTSAGVLSGAHFGMGLARSVTGLPVDYDAARLATTGALTAPLTDTNKFTEPNSPTGEVNELAAYPTQENRDVSMTGEPGETAMLADAIDKACASCHVGSKGSNRRYGDFRSAGCASCHMLYDDDGRSRSSDPFINKAEPTYDEANPGVADAYNDIMLHPGERPHPYQHRLTRKLPAKHCGHCHNQSNYTVFQFKGLRPDPNGDLQATFGCQDGGQDEKCRYDSGLRPGQMRHGLTREQVIEFEDLNGDGVDDTPPDVHFLAGLECVDCHTATEMHGDNTIKSRMDQATVLRCSSCHGSIDQYADPATSGVANLIKQGSDARPSFFLKSKVTGRLHYVYQVRDSALDVTPGARDPRTGQRVYARNADYAHGRYNGVENLDDGMGIKLLDASQPAGETTRDGFSHADTLECNACHATWGNMCYGCHLTLSDYDPAGAGSLVDYSNISGKLTPGKLIQKDVTWVSMLDIQLGINSRGKVSQFTPAGKVFFRHIDQSDTDQFQSDFGASYRTYADAIGYGNKLNASLSPQDPELGGIYNSDMNSDQNGALAFNPVVSHTVQRKPRNCTQCHIPVGHEGTADEDPYVRQPMVTWGVYPGGASVETSAYLASVQMTTQRDSGAQFGTSAGFVITDPNGFDNAFNPVSNYTAGSVGEFATATAGDVAAHRLDWVVLEDGFPLASSIRPSATPTGPLARVDIPGGGAGPLPEPILTKLKTLVRVYDFAEFTRTGNLLEPIFFEADVVDGDADGFCPTGVDNNDDGDCRDPGEVGGQGPFDCDDTLGEVNPDALEDCADGTDNNCDTFADAQDAACEGGLDGDGDGWCPAGQDINSDGDCIDQGESDGSGVFDCNDDNIALKPDAPEDCFNAADDNCNNRVDAADIECAVYADKDRDGWCASGKDNNADGDCTDPTEKEGTGPFDCQEGDVASFPGATENCTDGKENNCDGRVDCGVPCRGCSDGIVCGVKEDCLSGVCTDGRCQVPTCTDQVKNGQETDTDCGGLCAPCADLKACTLPIHCQSGVCVGSQCQVPVCTDNIRNGQETDLDCGGPCPDCADFKVCSVAGDCRSAVCANGACKAPACNDQVENGSETGRDCGGSCAKCANGLGCALPADCTSGVCTGSVCQAAACDDTVQNGNETDLDCGGACVTQHQLKCEDFQKCRIPADCVSGVCTGLVCQAASCTDHVKNGDETAADCGGSCNPCAANVACAVASDCQSGVCDGTKCVAAACNDSVQNALETDVDCGPGCNKCAPFKRCSQASDCVSNVCDNLRCAAPSCTDHQVNGDESAEDCGGSCAPCGATLACNLPSDCESGVCTTRKCKAPACNDQVINGLETDLDCGGGSCSPCLDNKSCVAGSDCNSRVCTGGVCRSSACNDRARNGDETDIDCGGTCSSKCADSKVCSVSADCASGVCSSGICQTGICGDGARNGLETDIDCGGSCQNKCLIDKHCAVGGDCVSGVCTAGTCQAAACDDLVRNGDETDVDCGGGCPSKCADGKICSSDLSCVSKHCDSGRCVAATCNDGYFNGDETAKDCGGSCATKCGTDNACRSAGDCVSKVCTGGLCIAPACNDLVRNGQETDIDCGPGCNLCADHKACTAAAHCLSGVCDLGFCKVATCNDEVRNGSETAIDCGGSCDEVCANGARCTVGNDCASGVCGGGAPTTCQAPTCGDAVQNGSETDVGCGGSCPTCAAGKRCAVAADCASGVCSSGVCAEGGCADNTQNNGETAIDCGGGTCRACAENQGCLSGTDCLSKVCNPGTLKCAAASCTDDQINGSETDLNCGGSCPDCAVNASCKTGGDCLEGVCTAGKCVEGSCSDSVRNEEETAADCGGAECPKCSTGKTCTAASDCVSGVCNGTCQAPTCTDNVLNGSETGLNCGGTCPKCADNLGCSAASDCQSGVCTGGFCRTANCGDLVLNGSETDIDCGGGGACGKCADGKKCIGGQGSRDCASGVCTGNVCQAATCSDTTQNAVETDVDCGGGTCLVCIPGKKCTTGSDCASRVCDGTRHCTDSACNDGTRNGSETDVDCGGACVNKCAAGKSCSVAADCGTGVCTSGVCQAAKCDDDVLNGTETFKDCGGACSPCLDGQSCLAAADCVSHVCTTGTCRGGSCSDSVQNGGETDIDCGGAGSCNRCVAGAKCGAATDCASSVCTGNRCQTNLCTDGVKNGNETGVDCGGACGVCANGLGCTAHTDCQSGVCKSNVCQAPTCSDLTRNGAETDADCGGTGAGSCPAKCADSKRCAAAADCLSGVCANYVCQTARCNDGVKNGDESDTDCGGSCADCADTKICNSAGDCTSGVCTGGRCQVPACTDHVQNGQEPDVDCGSSCQTKCVDNKRCGNAADCASGVCTGGQCKTATCSDGVQNGNSAETDVDCGGGTCNKCQNSKKCSSTNDCLSGVCTSGRCAVPACDDGVKNGNETDVDCGGGCNGCTAGKQCSQNSDCQIQYCQNGACANVRTIRNNGGVRWWSDGTYSSTCSRYRNPGAGYAYQGDTGDGLYRIAFGGGTVDVYCDQTTAGGGWTMIGHYRHPARYEDYMYSQNNSTYGADVANPNSGGAWTDFRVLANVSWPIEYAFVLDQNSWFSGWESYGNKVIFRIKHRGVMPHYGSTPDLCSGDNMYFKFWPSDGWSDIGNYCSSSWYHWYPMHPNGQWLVLFHYSGQYTNYCGRAMPACGGTYGYDNWYHTSRQLVREIR